MLSLVSAVAQAYFELQELDGRLSIARNSTDSFESTHALFDRRYGAGITSRLAVSRAESVLAEASGTVADIERQVAIKEHQICVLLRTSPILVCWTTELHCAKPDGSLEKLGIRLGYPPFLRQKVVGEKTG